MTAALRHRGPDGNGTWAAGAVGLGNARLSIIGIDERGRQPLTNEDGSVVISYNGEIYNYRQLRNSLTAAGHTFSSSTDTEVLVHGYEEWGIDHFLDRVNGIFAFALWDERRKRLVLARDRLGVKRLYTRVDPLELAFASEIAALTAGTSLALDSDALDAYFAFGYVPEPATLWTAIRCLPAGSLAICEDGSVSIRRYWELRPRTRATPLQIRAASDLVAQHLETAVARQLVSDVPVGLFLSGGLDSMAIALFASKHASGLKAFTLGFADDKFDESGRAAAIAHHLRLPHRVERLQSDVWPAVTSLVRHMGHPFADSSAIAVSMVAALAATEVKVVLTGDGGDELFGGYSTYSASALSGAYASLPAAARDALSWIANSLPVTHGPVELGEQARRFTSKAVQSGLIAHTRWREYFGPAERRQLLGTEAHGASRLSAPVIAEAKRFSGLDQYLAFDVLGYLPSDMLYKLDIATMWHSLEARVPFLDHELVELAFSIEPHLKRLGMQGKRVLREALKPHYPASLVAGKKHGFNVPIGRWLAGPLRERLSDAVSPGAKAAQIIDPDFVNQLVREHAAGTHDHSYKLWAVLVFTLWYESLVAGGV